MFWTQSLWLMDFTHYRWPRIWFKAPRHLSVDDQAEAPFGPLCTEISISLMRRSVNDISLVYHLRSRSRRLPGTSPKAGSMKEMEELIILSTWQLRWDSIFTLYFNLAHGTKHMYNMIPLISQRKLWRNIMVNEHLSWDENEMRRNANA